MLSGFKPYPRWVPLKDGCLTLALGSNLTEFGRKAN